MPRWKKPDPEEIRASRREIAKLARQGNLRFPQDLSRIRRSFGMSQERFADITGLTRRQIAEIEGGVGNPTLATMRKIGRIFGFSVGYVIPTENPTAEVEDSDTTHSNGPKI